MALHLGGRGRAPSRRRRSFAAIGLDVGLIAQQCGSGADVLAVFFRTALLQPLSYLKMYFPQVLGWFSEVTSPIARDFLERWPSLQKLQKARPETLRKFFIQRHSCKLDNIDRRLEEIRRAMPATHDAAVTCSCSAAALALVGIVRGSQCDCLL
jgi:hypothetical protein